MTEERTTIVFTTILMAAIFTIGIIRQEWVMAGVALLFIILTAILTPSESQHEEQ